MILLFGLTFSGRVPISPIIPYNIEFVQRVFTESAAFETRFTRAGRGFTVVQQKMDEISKTKRKK
jgi:hypothetical protein